MDTTKGILFGQIAQRYGFVTMAQVHEALDRQERYLEAKVQKPIGEILKEMGLLSDRKIARILRAQGLRRGRLDSKEHARIAVDSGLVTREQMEDALAEQKRVFIETKTMRPLQELLLERGHVNRRGYRALLRAIKRIENGNSPSTTTVAWGVKECPSCFETISSRAEECPHCHARPGPVEVAAPVPRCPACQTPKNDEGEFCAKCGANVVTGEMAPRVEAGRCPGCGRIMSPGQRVCFECHYVAPSPAFDRMYGDAASLAGQAWESGRLFIGLAALVLIGIAAVRWWPRVSDQASKLAYGTIESTLRDRADAVARALLYRDYDRIRSMSVQAPVPRRDEEILADLTTVRGLPVEVTSCGIAEYHAEGSRGSVYANVELKCLEDRPSVNGVGNAWADLEASLGQTLSKNKVFTRKTTWHFEWTGDDWRLTCP